MSSDCRTLACDLAIGDLGSSTDRCTGDLGEGSWCEGDGRADDGPAIRAAINVIEEAGGWGNNRFSRGNLSRYGANQGTVEGSVFALQWYYSSRCGDGAERDSRRRRSRPYDVIFEGVDLNDVAVMDLGFDANGTSNPVVTDSDSVSSPYIHTLLHLNGSKGVQIHRCKFTNVSGVWAIFASEGMERVVIDSAFSTGLVASLLMTGITRPSMSAAKNLWSRTTYCAVAWGQARPALAPLSSCTVAKSTALGIESADSDMASTFAPEVNRDPPVHPFIKLISTTT